MDFAWLKLGFALLGVIFVKSKRRNNVGDLLKDIEIDLGMHYINLVLIKKEKHFFQIHKVNTHFWENEYVQVIIISQWGLN